MIILLLGLLDKFPAKWFEHFWLAVIIELTFIDTYPLALFYGHFKILISGG
jgi:hypothetical protein